MNNTPTRVLIIGAGFAGLWAARRLGSQKNIDVTLIDRNNYHTFLPLLYQVAAAELEPEQIAYPIRGIFRKHPTVRAVLDEVLCVDTANKIVRTADLSYEYDHLIIATGSSTAFFGVPGAEEYSYTLKSLDDAVQLRNRLLTCFETAAKMPAQDRPQGLLQVAVIGGGPTGVEYAGALSELMRGPLAKDFPELANTSPQVLLIDGADKPLVGFPDKLRDYTIKQLQKMDVQVHLGSAVSEVSADGVTLKDGTFIPSYTVVWAAGVCGTDMPQRMGLATGKGGRVEVLPTLQVKNHPEIQIVGDLALVENLQAPMVAPNATQQGLHAANNIIKQINDEATVPFTYWDKGSMVTIGRSSAVARLGKYSFTGFFAWFLWIGVHLAFLIGFRNRIFVFINWAWDYLFFERAVRLILPKEEIPCLKGCVKKKKAPEDANVCTVSEADLEHM